MRALHLPVAIGVAIALAACSSGSSVNTGNGGASKQPNAKAGGTLNVAIGGEPDQLDPQKTSAYYSFEVLENVYDTLVQPGDDLQMEPAIAESWTTSPDKLTWTFTIRQGVKFSDGTPLTASDVVYSYDRIRNQKLANNYKFATVDTIKAPSATSVVITLKQPTPNLLASLGSFKGMAIVEKANAESGAIKDAPVGTGPFKVASFTHGNSIKLVANPSYWGGAPKLAGVTYTFVSDPTVALQNLQGGEVQWTDNLPPQQISSLKNNSDLTLGTQPSNDYWYLATNQARKPYSDVRVRQAIASAIDRDAIAKAAKFGNATVNETAIPKTSSWYYDYSPYSRDVSKAKGLMKAAGVSSLTMDLMVTSEYPETVSAAQVIASELKDIGITVKIRTLDFAAWLDQEGKGKFDMFMLGWLGNIDPDEFYYAQHHTGASFNFQKYSNPAVDKALDAARVEADQAKRKDLYAQAAKMIVDDASYIYLYNPDVDQAWSKKVQGYNVRPDRAIRFKDVSLAG